VNDPQIFRNHRRAKALAALDAEHQRRNAPLEVRICVACNGGQFRFADEVGGCDHCGGDGFKSVRIIERASE
jgi:hypothetical protein